MTGQSTPTPTLILVQITAPHFCAGILYSSDTMRVVQAAPILRWTITKSMVSVRNWVKDKRYGWFEYCP